MAYSFHDVARLPAPHDNVAIATRQLAAGSKIQIAQNEFVLTHTVLTGHRFAVRSIQAGDLLLSWGQPFGMATKAIQAGEYVCNADVLRELASRTLDIELPDNANFQNASNDYHFDEATFVPAKPLARYSDTRTFMGYERGSGRGVGTRNSIIILGTTSLVSGFVRRLEEQLTGVSDAYSHIDNIVAVAHTEGAHDAPNNEGLLLRTLAGLMVHPNVGAVLIVDAGHEVINNKRLVDYAQRNGYPLDAVIHQFVSLSDSFDDDISRAKMTIEGWLDAVNAIPRTPQPLSNLKIALQCGGSDAFSGISGNPLAAWVAKEVIAYGGSANLAETDELIGAESYVLDKVRSAQTAQKFLRFIDRFKERVAWHGHSADGNPSGGNKYRGLYNIYLKSLGAATKRHPDVPLDYVIEYSEPMREPGFYFMDSPGNDLESIAGQVAAGCNMIFFVTGNGSITNFPFVPTVKIVTTTDRYTLLADDMDINAGAYLDGTPLADLGKSTLNYTLEIAGGQLSVGEKAGHSQVQIWRDWQLSQPATLEPLQQKSFSREPISIDINIDVPDVQIDMLRDGDIITSQRAGLILPTSLCSGQIARLCVNALNQHPMLKHSDVSHFVTLAHTEGCGSSINAEFDNTLLGYLKHPFIKHALLLEHGCEATHNDYFRNAMRTRDYFLENYGWASIQQDGGIQSVIRKMVHFFDEQIASEESSVPVKVGLSAVSTAITTQQPLSSRMTEAYARLTRMIVAAGGTVILHEQDNLLNSDFLQLAGYSGIPEATLEYAGSVSAKGLHIMAIPTRNWGETLTGLGASGIQLILNHTSTPLHGHPMIPVLQVSDTAQMWADIALDSGDVISLLLDSIVRTLSGRYVPRTVQTGNVNFQITRGLLGVSL